MKNFLVANVFERIADLMEIDGDSSFKINAYRNAAQIFSNLTDSVEELAERDALREIPGIGQAIEGKTLEILQTGTCGLYDRLTAKYPESILDILQLPGVGVKTVKALYEQLGITGIDQLKTAAEAGRLREIPRMSANSEKKILDAIQRFEARPKGLPIAKAWQLTEALSEQLSRHSLVKQSLFAGDARRMLEFCPGVAAVALVDNPHIFFYLFMAPGDNEIEELGPNHIRIHRPDAPVDIYADLPKFAGSALARATGSEAHLRKLEYVAQQKGLRFESTRIWNLADEPLETPDEEAFYALLGMQFIPPEIREDTGEIELALEGKLPRLVEAKDLRGDLHSHTVYSDGKGSPAEMASAAIERGYQYLAITDHSQSLTVARGLTVERLLLQGAEIDCLNQSYKGFQILKGIEVDIRNDGSLDLPDDALAKLDFVVASIHSAFNLPEDEMTARAILAISNRFVDVMAHPTGRLLGQRDAYALDVNALISAAATQGKALEINSFPDRLDLNATNARSAADSGVKIAISTDSHNPSHLTKVHFGVSMARRGWLKPEEVLNTMSSKELLDWKKSRS